jgi:hypothetical protein
MLSDATRIVEVDMPYAEREGESKLRVGRDGLRFLRVILESALLYKSGRILFWGAAVSSVLGALLMLRPLFWYLETRTVAEWMIYRFLVSALAAQTAVLLWGASVISARIGSIAMHEEVLESRAPLSGWLRTGWFFGIVATRICAGAALVWPSVVQLSRTGHTDVHWSRFVVAMGCFGITALLFVIRGVDHVLDLVEARVRHLRSRA